MSSGNDNLRDALRALADETSSASAPDRVRANLRGELRARARRRRIATWWPAAAVAALILGAWLGMPDQDSSEGPRQVVEIQPAVAPPTQPASEALPSTPAPTIAREPGGSLAATPRARLASASTTAERKAVTPWFFYTGLPATERGQVVSIQVSRETAAQFGVYAASGNVPAQVFIGDDGLTRAIRFIR